MSRPRVACLVLGVALVLSMGCLPPSQLFWSPDGRRAGYWANKMGKGYLVDEEGKIVKKLGVTTGAGAWSGDSSTLYYFSVGKRKKKTVSIDEDQRWRVPSRVAGWAWLPPQDPLGLLSGEDEYEFTLKACREKRVSRVFSTSRFCPYYMDVSPDGRWLAILASARLRAPVKGAAEARENEDGDTFGLLLTYSLSSGRLFLMSDQLLGNFCFTGPARIAWGQLEAEAGGPEGQRGSVALTEGILDESRTKLEASLLKRFDIKGDKLAGAPMWLATAGTDVLWLTQTPEAEVVEPDEPAEPRPETSDRRSEHQLYRFSRSRNASEKLAELAGPILTVSPDATNVLIERWRPVPDGAPGERELAVLTLADGRIHSLLSLEHLDGLLPAWASWRGSDQVSFIHPPDRRLTRDRGDGMPIDLVLYRLTEDHRLESIRTMSRKWPKEMRPWLTRPPRLLVGPATVPAAGAR